MQKLPERHLVGQRTHNAMNPRALHLFLFLLALACVHSMPRNVAKSENKERTALPLLFLLSYPQANLGGGILPGVPIRRPHDELPITQKPTEISSMSSNAQLSDELPQSAQSDEANNLIREQFLQGILQGLQMMTNSGAPAINSAVLSDFLVQLNAVTTTEAPKITPPTVEKEAQMIQGNDADYDYIDFKNGSRIKYDLDNDQQSADDVDYPNKILVDPQFVGYFRSQHHAI